MYGWYLFTFHRWLGVGALVPLRSIWRLENRMKIKYLWIKNQYDSSAVVSRFITPPLRAKSGWFFPSDKVKAERISRNKITFTLQMFYPFHTWTFSIDTNLWVHVGMLISNICRGEETTTLASLAHSQSHGALHWDNLKLFFFFFLSVGLKRHHLFSSEILFLLFWEVGVRTCPSIVCRVEFAMCWHQNQLLVQPPLASHQ